MKKYLFNILPDWLKRHKYSDKVAHIIYGVFIYFCLTFMLPNHLALFITWTVALGVELKDGLTHKADIFDFLSTIIVPTILYAIKP